MLKALRGDFFASQVQTLGNTVNCVGVMGKVMALEWAHVEIVERWPSCFVLQANLIV